MGLEAVPIDDTETHIGGGQETIVDNGHPSEAGRHPDFFPGQFFQIFSSQRKMPATVPDENIVVVECDGENGASSLAYKLKLSSFRSIDAVPPPDPNDSRGGVRSHRWDRR